MLWLSVLLWLVALVMLSVIAVIDLKRRIIPNELVLATLGTGIALRVISASGMLWQSALVMASTFLVLCLIARFGVIGGGDVKLIPAVSLLVPANQVLALLLDVAIAGGALSIACLVARERPKAASLPQADFGRSAPIKHCEDGL